MEKRSVASPVYQCCTLVCHVGWVLVADPGFDLGVGGAAIRGAAGVHTESASGCVIIYAMLKEHLKGLDDIILVWKKLII